MEYRLLGRTGIRVSRLCFGSLTIGPLQANLSVGEGARLIGLALDQGVNFIDTADLYGTYAQIKMAIGNRDVKPVLASKSYAYTKEGMREALQRALCEMDVPCVDIFLLHEQESHLTLLGHRDALDYLLEAKRDGLVRAVGFSCHTVAALVAAQKMPEIDVVHPLVNYKGVGTRDGTVEDVLNALTVLHKRGTGVFAMKPLGGGHLIGQSKEAFGFVRSQSCLDSVAVGMASSEEIEYNCALFANVAIPEDVGQRLSQKKRYLQIHDWCTGCASCQSHCPQDALHIRDGKMSVDEANCVLCGYCGAHCPDFCLKIY